MSDVTILQNARTTSVDARGESVEQQLVRAASTLDLAVEILFDHWHELRPETRDDLIESLRAAAQSARNIAGFDEQFGYDAALLDEILGARLSCL